MKKLCAIILAVTLSCGMMLPVHAVDSYTHFVDVPKSFWAYDEIERAYIEGVVSGVSWNAEAQTGVFSPNATLTNAQFATILAQGFFAHEVDKTTNGLWYMPYLTVLQNHGLLSGTEVAAAPNEKATRYDMSVIMVKILRYMGISMPNDLALQNAIYNIGDWASIPEKYQNAVAIVYALKLISGINDQGDFSGSTGVTRAAMCIIYCRLSDIIYTESNAGSTQPTKEYYPGTDCLTYTSIVNTPLKKYSGSDADGFTYTYEYELNEYGKAKFLDYSDYLVEKGFSLIGMTSGSNPGYVFMKGSVGISIMILNETNEVMVIIVTI